MSARTLRTLRAAGVVAVALAVLAAGSVFSVPRTEAGPAGLDISGDWNLELTGLFSTSCTLEITQAGAELSGPWQCPEFGAGTFSGVISGGPDSASFTLDAQTGSVTMQAEGLISPDGHTAAGTWQAQYQAVSINGDFTATRKTDVVGDANCDEEADAVDAALILQLSAALLDSLACERNADINGDGGVGAVDAGLVLQFVAGLLDSLPSGGGFPSPIVY